MNAYAADPFGPSPLREVRVEVYSSAFRMSGTTATRFARVADIVNQMASNHLILDGATLTEFASSSPSQSAAQLLVSLDEVLFMVAEQVDETSRSEMRIAKRPVHAQVALPPFRLSGTVHVPQGSRPADGLLNAGDRFLPMTDVTVSSGQYPAVNRHAPAVAMQLAKAHLIVVSDDERPEELLAEVLDEDTAERWLHAGEPAAEE
jgi:hypothetical protein